MDLISILSLVGVVLLGGMILFFFFILGRRPPSRQGIHYQTLDPGYRRYTISIPEGYDNSQPAPLVIALHNAGHHGFPYFGEQVLTSLFEPALKKLQAVIIAPDCPVQDWTHPASEELVLDLLNAVQSQFLVDRDRIIVAGYSMGGSGAWHFAQHPPFIYSAAVVVAGNPPGLPDKPERHLPVMVIHGRNDEVFPLAQVTEKINTLLDQGTTAELRILAGVSHDQLSYYKSALQNAVPWILDRWDQPGALE